MCSCTCAANAVHRVVKTCRLGKFGKCDVKIRCRAALPYLGFAQNKRDYFGGNWRANAGEGERSIVISPREELHVNDERLLPEVFETP